MLRILATHTLSHAVRTRTDPARMMSLGVTLYRRGLSLLTRLALGGMLAVLAAILIGAFATAGGFVQLLVTAFAAMALWIPAFLLVSRFAEWRLRRQRRAALAEAVKPSSSSGPAPVEPIDAAWNSLAAASGSRAGEVRRIEQQLAAVWKALPAQSLDPQVHELQLLIGKRIPQLIDAQLACLPLRRSERQAAVDELVELISSFTDDSVERYGRIALARRDEHAAVRRRIESHISRDGLAPLA